MFERKRKLPANDPRAVAVTASIAKLLACEMLPYRVVETNSFKGMMSVAIPRYVVPSRYHFARSAVPELHEHVVSKITRSLKNAVACKVHLTTDTWTSAFGQGRYISLTAHWVNLVEPGSDSSPATARVLPTPQTAAPPSLPLDNNSSTYLSDSFSSNASQSCTSSGNANPAAVGSWKQCSTAVGMRQQALLKLICLGDKQHTGEEIWRGIKEQTDLWLAPLDLKPGMVVCDNGSNLIRALRLAKLTHIPCLAHVMNLVVQRFLRTYPGVADLLVKVRRVAKHCRTSSTASGALAKMQERFNLPHHRLLCDVPTRWNSTLHMLARFCEQKSAVVQYMTAQYRGASGQLPSFCGSDWANMLDLCQVLQNFEQSTLLVSSDNSSVSITIPLLCLLKRSMLKIKETAVMMQLGESEGENDQRDGTNIRPSASGNAGPSSYDEEEEEEQLELEQEFPATTDEGQSGARWTSTIQREWSAEADQEEGDDYDASQQLSQRSQEDDEDSGRTLAHMAQFMLDCIERDPRIVRILDNTNYWVYTLLDPRYKHNVPKLLEERVRQVKMEEYQQALVETLERRLTSSPSSSQLYADRLTSANPGRPGGQQTTQAAASAQKGMVSAVSLEWENFLTPMQQQPTEQQACRSTSNTDRLEKMVKDYMSDGVAVLNNPSAPFNYWVSKLDTWHELAMYAIEVLACPAASVMSERCFSAAGGIVTDRRIRLSTENADRLTQIKMNQSWIGNDYATLPDPNQVT